MSVQMYLRVRFSQKRIELKTSMYKIQADLLKLVRDVIVTGFLNTVTAMSHVVRATVIGFVCTVTRFLS